MTGRDWVSFNQEIVEEFRAKGGRVARFGDLPVIILHTIGAVSGAVRLTPLIPVFDGDDMFVFATAAGAPKDPAWVANLLATPRITIESADGDYRRRRGAAGARRGAADDRRASRDHAAARGLRRVGSTEADPGVLGDAGCVTGLSGSQPHRRPS